MSLTCGFHNMAACYATHHQSRAWSYPVGKQWVKCGLVTRGSRLIYLSLYERVDRLTDGDLLSFVGRLLPSGKYLTTLINICYTQPNAQTLCAALMWQKISNFWPHYFHKLGAKSLETPLNIMYSSTHYDPSNKHIVEFLPFWLLVEVEFESCCIRLH